MSGTPRAILKLDGFLTGRSDVAPQRVALDYVRAHLGAFGLSKADLANLKLVKNYTDIGGTHHFAWAQIYRGIPAFDNQIAAAVTKDGRLVNVLGPAVANFSVSSTTPRISASDAVNAALRNLKQKSKPQSVASKSKSATRKTMFAGGNSAQLVIFGMPGGRSRLGWQVRAQGSPTEDYTYVIDADNGSVLWRNNSVDFLGGSVWEYYPSAIACGGGCTQRHVDFPSAWATQSGKLQGDFAHAYVDANDDNTPDAGIWPSGDDVVPGDYAFTNLNSDGVNCSSDYNCSWDSYWNPATSWETNVDQNTSQLYYYVSKYHDHLLNAPIGFTEAAGNFQQTNTSGHGLGGDPVQAQADDGASIQDSNHIDNANMSTQADGLPPRMQMYLFRGGDFTSTSPDANGGDDASVVYHEYTHGLSNRLVSVGANDTPALDSMQSGAMGEGWSDWYAMDYLVDEGYDADTATVGDVNVGFFVSGGTTIRSEPMDCPVDPNNDYPGICQGGLTPHYGGYTYGDYGQVTSGPEVHADGEIWAQTLQQIRENLGSTVTETIVTRGMELSPPNPSFLDMRNAIIQADNVNYAGAHRAELWTIFAQRGMGYFASTLDGNDTTPVQDFTTEAAALALPTGTLSGKVTDGDSGSPVSGVSVGILNHNSGSLNLVATTNASGNYTIAGIPQHTYAQVVVQKTGYDAPAASPVTISGGSTTTLNFSVRRDWASIYAGGTVHDFTPPDYSDLGCGPSGAFDQSLTTGWGSTSPTNGASGPKSVTVQLPQAVNLSLSGGIQVDPGATCGDTDDASLAHYLLETSKDGTTWLPANLGTFNSANDHHLNALSVDAAAASGVRYVRLTMQSTQGVDDYMDVSEVAVYGTAVVVPPTFSLSSATYSVNEGAGSAAITIKRTGLTSGANSVHFATANGTATAGSDYTAVSQTVSFAAGQTSKTVSIPITNDSVVESNETVSLSLTSPSSGATLGTPHAGTLTIVDNDRAFTLSSAAYSVNEGAGSAVITIKRTGLTSGADSVHFATANGTATAGSDYTAVSQTVSFAAGQTSKTVSIPITDDSAVESNETVSLSLTSPSSGATLGTPHTATLTIVDNDRAAPPPATAGKGKIVSAKLSKKSFFSSQARKVKLTCKFSPKSKTFRYVLSIKKGKKWQAVKRVSKKSFNKVKYTLTVKKLFAGKPVKRGAYRLKLSADKNSKTLRFKVR